RVSGIALDEGLAYGALAIERLERTLQVALLLEHERHLVVADREVGLRSRLARTRVGNCFLDAQALTIRVERAVQIALRFHDQSDVAVGVADLRAPFRP